MKKKYKLLLNTKFTKKISSLAIYSPAVAEIVDGNVDIILVGDSLGTTLYGMRNTQSVSLSMMKAHGKAVIKNVKKSLTMIDMPYNTYKNKNQALRNAHDLLRYTKAKMIKLEINEKKLEIVKHLSKNNINVVAHLGVTPQDYKDFSKIKIKGKNQNEINILKNLAVNCEISGAKAILLECITEKAAKKITSTVSIPSIGIGASKNCDGQILVFDDLINLKIGKKKPKFVKKFLDFEKLLKNAVKKFSQEVREKKFPSKKYSYH